MKTLNYPHCVITQNNVYLSVDKLSCKPAFDTYLVNVKIDIDENGLLDIYGDEVQFGLNFHKEKLTDMDAIPQDDEIIHYKGLKLFGFYLIKPYDYVPQGWYELKERKSKRIILNKYKLEFI